MKTLWLGFEQWIMVVLVSIKLLLSLKICPSLGLYLLTRKEYIIFIPRMSYGNLMAHWMLDEIIENVGIFCLHCPHGSI